MPTVIFFRKDMFYPIEITAPDERGKTLEEQIAEQAEGNPGTTKVEDIEGNILWCLQ